MKPLQSDKTPQFIVYFAIMTIWLYINPHLCELNLGNSKFSIWFVFKIFVRGRVVSSHSVLAEIYNPNKHLQKQKQPPTIHYQNCMCWMQGPSVCRRMCAAGIFRGASRMRCAVDVCGSLIWLNVDSSLSSREHMNKRAYYFTAKHVRPPCAPTHSTRNHYTVR